MLVLRFVLRFVRLSVCPSFTTNAVTLLRKQTRPAPRQRKREKKERIKHISLPLPLPPPSLFTPTTFRPNQSNDRESVPERTVRTCVVYTHRYASQCWRRSNILSLSPFTSLSPTASFFAPPLFHSLSLARLFHYNIRSDTTTYFFFVFFFVYYSSHIASAALKEKAVRSSANVVERLLRARACSMRARSFVCSSKKSSWKKGRNGEKLATVKRIRRRRSWRERETDDGRRSSASTTAAEAEQLSVTSRFSQKNTIFVVLRFLTSFFTGCETSA